MPASARLQDHVVIREVGLAVSGWDSRTFDPKEVEQSMQNCAHGSAAPIDVLEGLPVSQAGAGRHKCVVCAFQRGQQEAIGGVVEQCDHGHSAPVEVLRALAESQAGLGFTRHRCAVCAYAAGADAALGACDAPGEVDLPPDRSRKADGRPSL